MSPASPERAALRAAQQESLRALLAVCASSNPFYREKFAAAGLGPQVANGTELFERLPFTTKPELEADQAAHPPWGTNRALPLADYTRFHQTSGTSGTPLRWLDTTADWSAMTECWMRVFAKAGVEADDRVFFAFSFGPFLGFWLAFDAVQRLGCLCIPAGGLSSGARVRLLLDTGATVLCCTPTYAIHLAHTARREGLHLEHSRIRLLMVAGEPGGSIPTVREHLSQLWNGARVSDHHGMTEVGPVTYECPAQPGVLHVMEDAFLAEVLDPETGLPTAAGATGELILTTLRRAAAPLIRYRTGDLVRPRFRPDQITPGLRCAACGSAELALEGGILSRVDDMAIVRGVNVYPSAIEAVIRRCGGVAEYRASLETRDALTELELAIEADLGEDPELVRSRLELALRETFALRIPVHLVPAGSLPRFEMKARRWQRK